jgi:hypothetical protein
MNLAGSGVASQGLQGGWNRVTFRIHDLPQGLYFAVMRIAGSEERIIKKMYILR